MKPIVINLCDAWQSYASFNFVGVFTNQKSFKSVIKTLIADKTIISDIPINDLNFMNVESLQNNLTYINLKEITFNELYV